MLKILVTGGLGFIGTNLIEKLLLNNRVTVLDTKSFAQLPTVKKKFIQSLKNRNKLELISGSVLDKKILKKVFSNKFDVVIHLASLAGVRKSIDNTELYFSNNVIGTINILDQMVKSNINHIIFASSSSVYGNSNNTPFSENDSTDKPISPYAASKKAIETLLYTYSELFGINTTILRFFTVYGKFGRHDMAPYIFSNKILNNKDITIYGNGKAKRDFTHVNDICEGIILSLEKKFPYEIFNLGSSNPISVLDLANLLLNQIESKSKILYKKPRQGDVDITYSDTSKARKLLDWQPKRKIEEGLKEYLLWLEKNS